MQPQRLGVLPGDQALGLQVELHALQPPAGRGAAWKQRLGQQGQQARLGLRHGEFNRFPALGRALYDGGPGRAIAGLAMVFARWTERGLLAIEDPGAVASHFNWLIMGEPVNNAMLLGDGSIPKPGALHRHAAASVRVFLAAYGRPG